MKSDQKITIDETEKLFLLLEDLQQFFHNEMHYETIDDLKQFLESKNVYKRIHEAYYGYAWDLLPKELQQKIIDR